jgi:DNA-binding CsgD family transcriptional regulator
MPRSPHTKPKLQSLVERIGEVRLEGSGGLGVLPEIREVLGLDAAVYFRLVQQTHGWAIAGFESAGLTHPTKLRRSLGEVLSSGTELPWLDLGNPNPAHRNKAVCVTNEIPPETLEASQLAERVFEPSELFNPHIVRVLLCEEDVVRGWIGGFATTPVTEKQRSMLDALVPPLLVRMRIERSLSGAPRLQAALEQTLQFLRAPAMIVDTRGRVHGTNRAADELLASKREAVMSSLATMLATRTPSKELTLVPTGMSDGGELFLAIWAARSPDERLEQAAALAGLRWQLTAREVRVLKVLVEGQPIAAIARELQVTETEAEQRISAILHRAHVSNRAQLVAAVLHG